MDLRGFGTRRRTWLEELRYLPLDYVVLAVSIGLIVGSTVLNLLGFGNFWVPPFLLNIASG
jgi:energy-coupling factor transport system permease protein